MTDTERLNLIEHYKWEIVFDTNIVVKGDFGSVEAKTLREAIEAALKAQFEWSVGK